MSSFGARGRARLVAVASLAIGAAIVACSGFATSPTNDAPESGAEGSTTEPSIDGAPIDAGPEASTAWIPCSQRQKDPAHFCDDFDYQAGDVTQRWNGSCLSDIGNCGQSPEALTLPRAFNAHTDKGPIPKRAQLVLNKDQTLDVSKRTSIVLSFWMKVKGNPFPDTGGAGRYTHVAVLELDDPLCPTSGNSKQRSVEISFFATTTTPAAPPVLRMATKGMNDRCLADGGGPPDMETESALVDVAYFTGAYHHLTVAMKRDVPCTQGPGSGGSVTLQIDSDAPKCLPVVGAFARAKKLKLLLGQFVGAIQDVTAEEFDVQYDNVTFDID